MAAGGAPARRRRRTPREAEGEIIAAASALLRERPFRELTVDEVMRRTDLSRPAFYVYVKDRHELVLRVVDHLRSELGAVSRRWEAGGSDVTRLLHEALEGIVGVFARHGPVLRALADAAADDPGVEQAYTNLVQAFVDVTAQHIVSETATGRVQALDPAETAKALVLMNERYRCDGLGREPFTPEVVVVETLATIWTRVLYPR